MMIHDNIVESACIYNIYLYIIKLCHLDTLKCHMSLPNQTNGTFWAASSIPSKYAPSLGLGFMVFSCCDSATNLVGHETYNKLRLFRMFPEMTVCNHNSSPCQGQKDSRVVNPGTKTGFTAVMFVASCKGLTEVLMEEL